MKKLDLHGVRHEDARRKVIRIVEDNWDKEEKIEIITGRSLRMKGVVLNLLDEYQLPYSIGYMYEVNAPRIITWT